MADHFKYQKWWQLYSTAKVVEQQGGLEAESVRGGVKRPGGQTYY